MGKTKQAQPKSAPVRQADEMQRRTRRERNFSNTEADLPNITPHTSPLQLLNPINTKIAARSKVLDLLSYLGNRNPLPAAVAANDSVWLLDNVAFRGKDGTWQAEFVAAVFAQRPSCKVIDAVESVAKKLGLQKSNEALETIEKRMIPFLQDIQPGRQVRAVACGSTKLTLGPGGRNGISSDVRKLPHAQPGTMQSTTAQVPNGADGLLQMQTLYAGQDGWGLISDIDDTIKVTQTSDPIGILQTTFIDDPTPVQGMPELYKYIQSRITTAAPVFYLSASPYNLYPFLRDFRSRYYPHGQLILRDASWMSVPGLLSNLTLGTQDYKVDRIKKIQGWLPKRKMICVGDSTQSDPEAYGDIYRAFPGWVKVILIRKVTDIAALGIEDKNKPERFEKAFEDVPRSVWHVFEDPAECRKIIEAATDA